MMSQYVEGHHSTVADFEEAAWVLEDDHVSPVIKSTLPSAGNTPTITRDAKDVKKFISEILMKLS